MTSTFQTKNIDINQAQKSSLEFNSDIIPTGIVFEFFEGAKSSTSMESKNGIDKDIVSIVNHINSMIQVNRSDSYSGSTKLDFEIHHPTLGLIQVDGKMSLNKLHLDIIVSSYRIKSKFEKNKKAIRSSVQRSLGKEVYVDVERR